MDSLIKRRTFPNGSLLIIPVEAPSSVSFARKTCRPMAVTLFKSPVSGQVSKCPVNTAAHTLIFFLLQLLQATDTMDLGSLVRFLTGPEELEPSSDEFC